MLNAPSRHIAIGAAVAGHEQGRGKVINKIEAQYHGCTQVPEKQGGKMTMDAVGKIQKMKQKPKPVVCYVTTKGVYIDEKKSKDLFKKVPITNLSYVAVDPRNKKVFSFIEHEARLDRKTCYTFSVKKHAESFKTACNDAIKALLDAGHRAEAEAALIAAATPIMPVQAQVDEDYYDDDDVDSAYDYEDEESGSEDEDYYSSHDAYGASGGEVLYDSIGDAGGPWVDPSQFAHFIDMFKAQYLGCCPVQEIEGHQIAMAAAERVRKMNYLPRDVTVVVLNEGITLVERRSGDYLQENSIDIISYSLLDPRDKQHFYYIINDPRIGFAYCHVLKLYSVNASISKALGLAHRAAENARRRLAEEAFGSESINSAIEQQQQNSLGVYECKYLGQLPVKSSKGNETVNFAVEQRHQELGEGEEGDWTLQGLDVVLVVNSESIKTVEMTTADLLCNVFIREVAFSTCANSAPGRQHDIFAFISRDRMSRLKCHMYRCPAGMARQVCKTVGWAFKLAMDEVQNEASNPFLSTGECKPSRLNVEDLFPEHLRIKRRNLTPIEAIGAGQFGKVFLADHVHHDRNTGSTSHNKVAVKMLRTGARDVDEDDFLREALVMVELDHPHLVKMVGVSLRATPWLVVLEYLKYGDLKTVLMAAQEKGVVVAPTEQMNFAMQLAAGMRFLASKRLVHMDLAARNCLLAENSVVKVADFGLAKRFDDGETHYKLKPGVSMKLPIKWMAIESFEKLMFSEKSDVWAFGVVLWEICSYGAQPYPKIRNKEIRRVVKKGLRLPRPQYDHASEMYAMMKRCWLQDVEKRPNFKQIYHALRKFLEKAVTADLEAHPEKQKTKEDGKPGQYEFRDIGVLAAKHSAQDEDVRSGASTTWTPSRKNKDGGYHDTDGFRKNNDGGYHDIDGYDNPDGGYSEVGAARKASLDNGIGLDDSDYKDIDTAFLKGGTGVVEQSKVERSNPLFAAQQDNYFDIGDIENYEDGELGLYFDIGENGMALPKDFVDMYSSGFAEEGHYFEIGDNGKAKPKHGTVVFYDGQKLEDLDGVYFDVDANGEVVTGDHIVMYTGYDEISGQGADSSNYFEVGDNGRVKPLGDEFGLDPSRTYSVVCKKGGCVELYEDLNDLVIELYDDVMDLNEGNYFDVDEVTQRDEEDNYFDVGYVEAAWNDEGDYFEVGNPDEDMEQIYMSVEDLRRAAAKKGKRLQVKKPKKSKLKKR